MAVLAFLRNVTSPLRKFKILKYGNILTFTVLLIIGITSLILLNRQFGRLAAKIPNSAEAAFWPFWSNVTIQVSTSGPKTEIIQSTVFENAVAKTFDGKIAELTKRQKKARKMFEITNDVVDVDGNLDFAESILRAKRACGIDDKLMNLEWLPLTTNPCERLFSRAKLSIGYLRHGLSFRAIPLCEERALEFKICFKIFFATNSLLPER